VNSPTVWVRPRRVDPTPYASLEAVADAIRAHLPCGFEPCETCTSFVPGEGAEDAEVMLVGEAPGASEDRQGRPFVGRAGALLDIALETAGLSRDAVFITNVLKARPPGNRDPKPAEVAHSLPWLEAQIALVRPVLLVTLGRHALTTFVPDAKITKVHGQPVEVSGITVLPLFHPAAALRAEPVKQSLEADVAAIPALLGRLRGHARQPGANAPG
jgi:uracil-DNA glycosylase